MPLTTTAPRRILAPENLYRGGFTAAQIARLAGLRDRYPHWEFVTSQREWDYLLFARWRYRNDSMRRS